MAKRKSLEQLLDNLAAVRRDPAAPDVRVRLLAGLASTWNVAVGKAAGVIGEHRLGGFGEPLAAAFDRMMDDPVKRDPQCVATIAIARALLDADAGRAVTYLRGLRHRQRDGGPGLGGLPADSAGPLRGYCGLGLLAVGHPDAMAELVDLLADPEVPARVAAARAIGSSGKEGAALVLRLKVLALPDVPDVLAECMAGLLRLDPQRSLPLVGGFLDHRSAEMRYVAALALGESRRPGALPLLAESLRRTPDEDGRAVLIGALAALRHPGAIDVLLDVLANGSPGSAGRALEALGTYRHDATVRERAARAVDARNDPTLRHAWQRAFPE